MKIVEIKKINKPEETSDFFKQMIRVRVKTKYGMRVVMIDIAKELFDDFENDKNFQKWVKWRALDETKRAIKEKENETL